MPTKGKKWTSNKGSVFDASFSRSASANGFLTRAHFFMHQIKVRIWYWIHIWPLSKPFDVIKPPLIERINSFICHGNLFLRSLATLNSITALKSECKSRRCVSLLRRQVTSTSTLPPTEKKIIRHELLSFFGIRCLIGFSRFLLKRLLYHAGPKLWSLVRTKWLKTKKGRT